MADDTNVGSSFSKISVDIADVDKKIAKLTGIFKLATTGVKGFTAASIAGFAATGAAGLALGLLVGFVLVKAFQKLYSAMKKVMKTTLDYNQALANTQSVARATASELGKLDAAARSAGETTRFTATEAADALYYLASAGFTATESISALEGVLALAQATNTSMKVTAEELAVVISQFGFEASDASRVANVFAASITSSQSTMEKMIFSFQQAGPIAAGLGISLEETAAATNLLTNSGYRGQRAGRALRKIFGQLSFETSTMSKKLRALGLDYNKFNVTTNTLTEAFGYLNDIGVSTSQAFASFGTVAAGQAAVLVNAGKPAWEEMTAAVTDTNRAYEAAFVQNDTLQGDLYRLKSASEAYAISLGNIFEPAVRKVTQGLVNFVRWTNNTIKAMSGQATPAEKLAGKVDLLADAMVGYQVAVDTLADSYDTLNTEERENAEIQVDKRRVELEKAVNAVIEENKEAVDDLSNSLLALTSATSKKEAYTAGFEAFKIATEGATGVLSDFSGALTDNNGVIFTTEQNLNSLIVEYSKGFSNYSEDGRKAIQSVIDSLQLMSDAMHVDPKQKNLFDLGDFLGVFKATDAALKGITNALTEQEEASQDCKIAVTALDAPLRILALLFIDNDEALKWLIEDYPLLASVVDEYVIKIEAERAAQAALVAATEAAYVADADYIRGIVDKLNLTDKYTKALFKETQAEQKRNAERKLESGDVTGALAIREQMLRDEYDLVEKALAKELTLKTDAATEDYTNKVEADAVIKEITDRNDDELRNAEKAFRIEYNAIAADYRQQDIDNLSDIAEEKIKIQQEYREATEKILEDLAAFSNAYANEVISASDRLSEAQAREQENAGKISEAYEIRGNVIAAGLKREQDALTANYEIETKKLTANYKIDAKKLKTNLTDQIALYNAYKKNKADLDAIYADKQSQSDIDAANAHAKYADDLLKIDADIANFSKKYTDDLVTAENTLREAEAKRLEAAGDIAGAYKIRGETIAASLKKEQDALTIKYDAEVIALGDNLDAKEALYIAYQESIAAIDGTYERKQRENDHNKAIADKAQFDAYVKLAFSTYESLVSIAQNAFTIMYANKQLELDKSMRAELEAAGFAEDTELEKLEKQLIAAK